MLFDLVNRFPLCTLLHVINSCQLTRKVADNGKLKCCLNFELDSYLDALNSFPSWKAVSRLKRLGTLC
jgi:cell fate regulator YaaT (PSP1 superfamily)